MSKIKGLIFDLDGVLVNTKKIHFDALNLALKKKNIKQISYKDHLNIYDGLPTSKKLEILNKKKILKKTLIKSIKKIKQENTLKLLNSHIQYNPKIYNTFLRLSKSYKISLATNAIKKNLKLKNLFHFAIQMKM
jgi:beta-phosphoglucomutase-like phosphatase (HAD superfamily)